MASKSSKESCLKVRTRKFGSSGIFDFRNNQLDVAGFDKDEHSYVLIKLFRTNLANLW